MKSKTTTINIKIIVLDLAKNFYILCRFETILREVIYSLKYITDKNEKNARKCTAGRL